MAGRARLLALKDELDKRTTDYFVDDDEGVTRSHLDYVCAWYEDGQTGKALALSLSNSLKLAVTYEALMRYLRNQFGTETADRALDSARVRASHSMAEEAVELVDNAAEFAPAVAKASAQARSRQWMAERYNPQRFGTQKGVSVNVSIGSLHLDALRARASVVTVGTQALLSSGESTGASEVQVVDAEVVE